MAKESTAGTQCKCGVAIYYSDYHWPHCPEKDTWQIKKEKKSDGGS